MATAAHPVNFEEYMNTSYSPDCEYIDGFILERNVGQGKHSYMQVEIAVALREQVRPKGLMALTEQRTRVSPYRVRVPDVSVVEELEAVTTKAPLLCVEILSPDDRWRNITPKISDYQEMGVPCVWVVDPWARRAWIFDSESGPQEIEDTLVARHLGIQIPLESVLPPA